MTKQNQRDVDPQNIQAILRNHKDVPHDIEPTLILRADQAALDNARSIVKVTCKDLPWIFFFPPIFLMTALTGVCCMIRKAIKFGESIMEDAENDIYVISKEGFATISNDKVKSWTPISAGVTIMPDMKAFSKRYSGCGGTSLQSQTVMIVQKQQLYSTNYNRSCCDSPMEANFKNGIYHQVWFVADNEIQNVMTQASLASVTQMGMGAGMGMGMVTGAMPNIGVQLNQMMTMANQN